MPFDQFTIEQLAGDLLPDATLDQQIATGFHRNTMLNEEGGIDPLEFRFYAMIDRVNTTGTVWLGLTVGCAQCHTHKYDPIPHREYYQFMALLEQRRRAGDGRRPPRDRRAATQVAAQDRRCRGRPAESLSARGRISLAAAHGRPASASAGGATVEAARDGSVRVLGRRSRA